MVRLPSGFALHGAFSLFLGCTAQAPPTPSNLQCPDGWGQPGQFVALADVDPISVDMVSFMAARVDDPEKWPFVHTSVSVGVSDPTTVMGAIPGLEAGVEYLLMARAHSRNQTDSYFIFWSDVAHKEVPCKAAGQAGVAATRPTAARTNVATDTTWIEVFRFNGNGHTNDNSSSKVNDPRNNITLPDYIAAHNTADLWGAFGLVWSTVYDNPWHRNGSFTRYCVEMQTVELHDVTTPTNWVPSTSQFADYSACGAGQCNCMISSDRENCRQPSEQLEAMCPEEYRNTTQQCNCSAERIAQSDMHIGMVHRMGDFGSGGRWYSMPPGGYCAPGAQIGDAGCTYRLSPLSHSLSLGNLNNKGVFDERWHGWWTQIAREAFDAIGAEPCGGAASAIEEQVMMA